MSGISASQPSYRLELALRRFWGCLRARFTRSPIPMIYAAAIRQGTYELTIIERGDFSAKLIRIDLHRLWMQRFYDNLPRISHIAGWGGRAVISFRTQPGPNLVRSGVERTRDR